MKKHVSYALAILIAASVPTFAQTGPTGTQGTEFAAAINLLQSNVKVIGTLFLPQKVSRVRAVIVVLRWGNGSLLYPDAEFRRLSETTESGLLLTDFATMTGAETSYRPRYSPDRVNGLVMLLQRLALESGHQELTDAPLLFWGHSEAGGFGPRFAAVHAERTIAFIAYQSAAGPLDQGVKIQNQIPALFLGDGMGSAPAVQAAWKIGRSAGAPWTFSIEPDATHGDEKYLKKANGLLIPWITAVLRQRLSPDGKALRTVSEGSSWIGNNQTGAIAPSGTVPGSKLDASWLPDEPSARAWQRVRGAAK